MTSGTTADSTVPTSAGDVSVRVDGPLDAATTLVLGPGAGADMRHPFMQHVSERLASEGFCVSRFNFPFAERGRRSPDKQAVLEETFRVVTDQIRQRINGRVFVGGKSMGGRIASMVVAAGLECEGLVFLGYPLHPPGRPERIRDGHLYAIRAPMLFVEGTRDPFCPLETLAAVREKLSNSKLAVVDDGDHSFKVRKSSGRSTDAAWDEVAGHVGEFLTSV